MRTAPAVKAYHSPARARVGPGRGQREVGLVGAVADGAVAQLVLVVACGRHPRPVAGPAAVVEEPVSPGADAVRAQVRVAQVPVDQVKQRRHPFDARGEIARGRRAEVVVDVGGPVQPAEGRCRLVTEAGEGEPAADRRGPSGRFRARDWTRRAPRRRCSRCRGQARSVGRGTPAPRCPISRLGRYGCPRAARGRNRRQAFPAAPSGCHRFGGVPRHDHLRGRVGPELQMQPGHGRGAGGSRTWPACGSRSACGQSGNAQCDRPAQTGCRPQHAAAAHSICVIRPGDALVFDHRRIVIGGRERWRFSR